MTETHLIKEIDGIIKARLDAGEAIPANWITKAVISGHIRPTDGDVDWFDFCTWGYVRGVVRKAIQYFKATPGQDFDEQLILPGHEKLQKAYLVTRNEEQTVVPINRLTDEELDQKIREQRSMADGCNRHATELERYRDDRRGKANAA